MANKKIILFILLLLSIFMIGSVSAVSDTNEAKSDLTDKSQKHIITKQIDKKSSNNIQNKNTIKIQSPNSKNNVVSTTNNDKSSINYEGTFDDLSTDINTIEEGGTLNLTKNYKYTSGSKEGIKINKSITIDGKGHSINGNEQSKIFQVINTKYLILKNLNINNGKIDGWGGVIYTSDSTINIMNCTFTHNTANTGGVIYANSGSKLIITNSKFIKNTAQKGGAIYINSDSKLTIKNGIFTNNTSPGPYVGYGGAIYGNGDNFELNITNSKFTNNTAKKDSSDLLNMNGGAIHVQGKNSNLNIIKCTFTNNNANLGGEIYTKFCNININNIQVNQNTCELLFIEDANLTILNSKFNNCKSGIIDSSDSNLTIINSKFNNCKSGIIDSSDSNLTIINSKFTNNTRTVDGVAIYIQYTGSLTIINSTFIENKAKEDEFGEGGHGGAIYVYGNKIKLYLTNSTFNNNKAKQGGAIYLKGYSKLTITNSNFNYNQATKGDGIYINNVNNTNIHKCIFTNNSVYCDGGSVDLSDCIFNPVKIITSTVTTVYNGNKYLVITLKDNKDKLLSGVKLSVNLNGVKTATTNNKGQIRISTNNLIPKTYIAKINLVKNNKYIGSSKNVKIIVKKANPKLTAKAKNFKKSVKIKKYKVTLKDNLKKAMKTTPVVLKVKGKTYTSKTNNNGVATFKITNLNKKGQYTTTITYKGDKKYNKISKKVKITIK